MGAAKSSTWNGLALAALLASSGCASAQNLAPAASTIAMADREAGDDPLLRIMRNYHCFYVDPAPAPFRPSVSDTTDFLFGVRFLDNVYYLGYLNLAAYAIQTSDGLVLIDAGGSEEHGRQIFEWLGRAGFAPTDLKWIIITHEHFDHFGGAEFLKLRTGAQIVAGADAAIGSGRGALPASLAPLAMSVSERTTLVSGDTQIVLLPTPGHTPGTISVFAPVTVSGQQHMASFWGGKGMRPDVASMRQMLESVRLFSEVSQQLGVDVPLNTHSWGDGTISRIINGILAPEAPNAFVLSHDQAQRNSRILEHCTSAYIQTLEAGVTPPPVRR